MDVNLTRQTLEAEKTLGAEEAQVLLRAETLVSGAGREEVEILMSDAAAVLDTVDVQAGRVLVEGKVKCEAAYRLGSENVVRALNAETALNHAFDMKDVAAGGIVRARVHVDDVRARYENGHMLFDVSVTVNAQAAQLNSVEALTGIEDAPDIEAKYEDIVSVKLNGKHRVGASVRQRRSARTAGRAHGADGVGDADRHRRAPRRGRRSRDGQPAGGNADFRRHGIPAGGADSLRAAYRSAD